MSATESDLQSEQSQSPFVQPTAATEGWITTVATAAPIGFGLHS